MQNKSLAIMVEVVAGWFGFLGIGHLILKDNSVGFTKLFVWWVAIIIMLGITLGSLGGALICIGPIWFVVPIISGISILATKG